MAITRLELAYLWLFGTVSFLTMIGCASRDSERQPASVSPAKSAPTPADDAGTPNAGPSNLSYGMVTSKVQKGVTTQAELVELFGGPNIATTDPDGTETWVYERSASYSQTTEHRELAEAEQTKLKRLGLFFGVGAAGSEKFHRDLQRTSDDNTEVTRSIRNLSVIVKFGKDKTVSDYSVRSATF